MTKKKASRPSVGQWPIRRHGTFSTIEFFTEFQGVDTRFAGCEKLLQFLKIPKNS
jgi:hypothetical protein